MHVVALSLTTIVKYIEKPKIVLYIFIVKTLE